MTDSETKPMEIIEPIKQTTTTTTTPSKSGFVNSTDIGELYDNYINFRDYIKTNNIDITDRNCPIVHINTLKKYHTELTKREEQMENFKKRLQSTTKGKQISNEVLDSFGQFDTDGGREFNTFVACNLEIIQQQDIEIAKLREANTKSIVADQLKNGNNKRSSSYRGIEEVEEQLSKRSKLINETSSTPATDFTKGTAPKTITYDPLNGIEVRNVSAAKSFLNTFVSKDYYPKFNNSPGAKEYLEKSINTPTSHNKPSNVTMDSGLKNF